MTRTVTIDLDVAEDVQTLWSEYARVRALREADPELRADLERLLPLMPEDRAAEIREALAYAVPAVVLAEYQDDFFAARFAGVQPVDASKQMPPRTVWEIDPYAEMLARVREEPLELRRFVEEMLFFFADDLPLVVRTSLAFASEADIESDTAEKVVTDTLRKARRVER